MKNKDLDNFFKSRSHSFDEMPSDDLWKKIDHNLAQEPKSNSNLKKTFLTMIVPIIALLSVASLYVNNNNSEQTNKPISTNDSIKKEKTVRVSDSNIQPKPTLIVSKKTSINNQLPSKQSNNSQSISKKDIRPENIQKESSSKESIINTNELTVEPFVQSDKGDNLKKEETYTEHIIYTERRINDSSIISNKSGVAPVIRPNKTDRNDVIEITETSNIQERIYDLNEVHIKPRYPGGSNYLYAFISKKFKTPNDCSGGRITLTFVVEKDGSLTNIQTVKDIGFGTGAESIRVLKESRKWIPGKQDGKIVRVQYTLPISIQPSIRSVVEEDNIVYNSAGIEVKPDFIGGMKKLYEFIEQNYKTPKDCPGGKVNVSFIVEKDGSLSDIKTLRDLGFGSGDEAIRVLNSCPKWEPGEQNGKKVRVTYSLAIPIKAAEK